MKTLNLRFYEELNDFLPATRRKKRFELEFFGTPSVKDIIESQGVPHTEVDLILVNGKSVKFNYKLKDGDDVSVYPMFESINISSVQKLRPKPLRSPKFVLDVHLGTLARYMRMCGFDAEYKNNFDDNEIINISSKEHRTILTRDIGILKHGDVTCGYFVRNTKSVYQIEEVIKRFDLKNDIKEFTRCITCNSILEPSTKEKVVERIPPKVREYYNEFFVCGSCDKVYWKGSHFAKMSKLIEIIKNN